MEKERPVFITSALPYANGPLHLGHILEHIQSDIYARMLKMMGKKVMYCCADDTHGTPIEVNAAKNNMTPEEFIKKWHKSHLEDLEAFSINYDSFYTTNSEESRYFTELIFSRLKKAKHIYTKEIDLMYCEHDKRFLPDRFIKGICPKCGAKDQYGDNCEACGTTYEPIDLIEPYCVLCKNHPVRKKSEHYFFRLSEFSGFLDSYLKDNERLQPEIRNQIQNWVKEGLQDWCISRDAPYFGFKIPGEEKKYFYVWLDAPIGYMASLAKSLSGDTKKAEKYWNDSEIIHFIGKDIIYFHLLFWPAVLKGSGFRTPDNVVVHGFVTVNGEKMSKSRGTFVLASDFLKTEDPEFLRYYFASNLTHTMTDIDLDFENYKAKVNNELVANIANFIYRTLSFTNKNYGSKIGKIRDKMLISKIRDMAEEVRESYLSFDYRKAVQKILEMGAIANKYFQDNEPWELIKVNKEETLKFLTDCVNIVKILAITLKPVMPKFSSEIESQLNIKELSWGDIYKDLEEHKLGDAKIVIKKIEEVRLKSGEEKPAPAKKDAKNEVEPFSKLNLKVVKVKSVSQHYNADKLLVINLETGKDESRQVVAGLKPYYPDPEILVGKHLIMVSNLEHANLRGEMSQGMLLAGETKDSRTVEVLEAPVSDIGEQVFIEGIKPHDKTIKFDDFMKVKIYVENHNVMCKGKQLQTKKEKIKTKKVDNGDVR